MKKIRRIFEAAVVITIALVFIIPSSVGYANEMGDNPETMNRDVAYLQVSGRNLDDNPKDIYINVHIGWWGVYVGPIHVGVGQNYYSPWISLPGELNYQAFTFRVEWIDEHDDNWHWTDTYYGWFWEPGESYSYTDVDIFKVPMDPGGSCFLAGTKIAMSDGSSKNIENVMIGDDVTSYDVTNKKLVSAKVSEVFHHVGDEMSESYLIINEKLRVTSNHPLFINGKWKQAGDAKIGDNLLSITSLPIPIRSIETVVDTVPTYNLEVDTYHNYFAEGILAHNKPPNFACLFIDEGP